MSSEILFLAHRIPFPPDRGDKIRSHNILKHLAKIAPVHVACFADDDADMVEEAELATLAKSYRLVRRSLPLLLAGIQGLLRNEPVSLSAFYSPELARYVAEVLATRDIGAIYVFSGQMGQYVPESFAGRLVVDFVDVDSAKFDAYAEKHRGPERWVHRREGKLLRREEVRLALRADHNLLISQAEADLFASRLSPIERDAIPVSVVGNGIDCDTFSTDRVAPEPKLASLPPRRMIFTGQMDYPPNIDAVMRMAERIMPRVLNQVPDASFHIVGRNPPEEVSALHEKNGVHVWGRVEDMRCWLAAADIAVVPLEIARGVQNKVLEAMAMRLPVVLTSGAATGIPAKNGSEFLVADRDEDIAAKAVGLLKNPGRAAVIGNAARRFVKDKQSWPAALAPLERLLGLTKAQAQASAFRRHAA
jgi:sugar transferase (PEP-CTERM/EpsH1 system associated)